MRCGTLSRFGANYVDYTKAMGVRGVGFEWSASGSERGIFCIKKGGYLRFLNSFTARALSRANQCIRNASNEDNK